MKTVVADVVMVFGRKSAPVKPKPPGVDEILEDLSKAAPSDPLFSLVPSVAKRPFAWTPMPLMAGPLEKSIP